MKCLSDAKQSAVLLTQRQRWLPLFFSLSFLFFSFSALAQTTVSGRVTFGDSALAGVTVQVKGTANATATDAQGKFTINAPANGKLVFSSVNFAQKEVALDGKTTINVQLNAVDLNLSEVVVIGYNSQKKVTLTGSVSVVKGADLVKSPQVNVSNSFAGRVTGMIVNNRSGEPGYDGSSILIRGLATRGNNDVLIVVDGVPGQIGGLERLNPNDIESISVLKDASAAIYGNRAANGVILITTKRGKSGKPTINASFNQGFTSPTRLPKMADAATLATIFNEVAYYKNPNLGTNQTYSAAEIQKFADGSDPLNYPNTDWAKASLKKTALQNQANISIAGGSDNVRYYVSSSMLNQDGLYKNGATKYKQYSFRSNIDANVTKDLKVSLYLSGRQEDRQYPTTGAGNIFRSIYRAFPMINSFFPNGLPSYGIEGSNPAVMGTDIGGVAKNPIQVFNGILKGAYNIAAVKGLSVDGFLAIDKSWNFSKSFSKPYTLYNYDKNTNTYKPTTVGGSNNLATLSEGQINRTQTVSNFKVNYQTNFGKHNIFAFVGYEQSQIKTESFSAYRENFPTTLTPDINQGGTGAADSKTYGESLSFTRKSYIGKISYNYDEKYLVDFNMRADGSSIFPKIKRYGYFPSASVGWRISQESFFDVPFINSLKLRASYGLLGNDNVNPFQYNNNLTFNNQVVLGSTIVPGIDLTKLANPVITWEEAKKTDIGLEATFLNHFNLEFIYFRQKRSNILAPRNASIANVTGIVNPWNSSTLVPDENIAKVNSNGIEATLGYNNRKGDFSYGISGNITYAKSKNVFIDEAAGKPDYQRETGRPMNTYLLYNAIGIFRSADDLAKYPHLSPADAGDLIYEDINKDGKITADDQARTKYGNIPEIMYGILLNGSYKDFDLSIVFSGQSHVSQVVIPEAGTVGNFYSSWADNRWSPTNPGGSFPRVDTRTSSSVNGSSYASTFWLNNASFLRLKNVELGYNLTGSLLAKTKMQSLRVYLNAFNVFTITKVKDYDPEGTNYSGQFYPQQRIVNVGVNVGL